MPYEIFLYVLFISLGCLGVGYFIWSFCKENSQYTEHPCLTWGISWFVGYFVFEGILSLLSVSAQFQPIKVITAGMVLSCLGIYCLLPSLSIFKPSKIKNIFEPFILILLLGFVFFWNLYPTYDVDSLSSYFASITHMLDLGGKHFSRFNDIRFSMPVGENMLYALGFAWQEHSTVFPQIIQGISKVMLLLCVFGAAKSLGGGVLSLIAPAMLLSEEHFIASGANVSVHINVVLVASIFLLFLGLLLFSVEKKSEYFMLALWAGLSAMNCKYLGVIYGLGIISIFGLYLLVHKDMRVLVKTSWQKRPALGWLLLIALLFTSVNYLYNWAVTGSLLFPSSWGALKEGYYDSTISRMWYNYLSLPGALKSLSSFMVWPGILPLKLLVPTMLVASLVIMFFLKKPDKVFIYGIYFFIMSVIVVIIQEHFIVFEMRYYRFGLGVYALAFALLLTSIWMCFSDRFKIPVNIGEWLKRCVVILICLYCIQYSFDVMGQARPSYKDIVNFMTHKKTESQIMEQRYIRAKTSFKSLQDLHLNPQQLAFFASFNWPHFHYSLPGKNINFMQAAAFPTLVYFNEGLFAHTLQEEHVKYIFNNGILNSDYPLDGGAAYKVINQCGRPVANNQDVVELSSECLEKLSLQQDPEDAKRRLEKALADIRSQAYSPFNPPSYGGVSNLFR